MRNVFLVLVLAGSLFFAASRVLAQPSVDTRSISQTTNQAKTLNDLNALIAASNASLEQTQQETQNLKTKVTALEDLSVKQANEPKLVDWTAWWWRISLGVGILWILLWIFVGWQWTSYGFWGFGWPWPWWFWIPLVWFIPWLIACWFWWLDWWNWWIWIWWVFSWVFWLFWWIILFKEAMIWFWRKK